MHYILFGITAIVFLFSCVYQYLQWRHSYWKRKGVPQLQPEFIYGDIKPLVQETTSIGETFLDYYKQFSAMGVKYGGVYSFYRASFIPLDPELVKEIMQKKFDHFSARFLDVGSNIFGKSLFHQEGETWRRTRKQLTPTFTSGKMKMMFETLWEKTAGLTALADECYQSSEPVNIKEVLGRFTSDVIASCGFGIESNSLKDPNSEFLRYARILFDPPKTKESYWGILVSALGVRRQRKDIHSIDRFFQQIVKETIAYREENEIYRKDFLHLMIELKNKGIISDGEYIYSKGDKNTNSVDETYIVAQCMIFFIAGYETSATTMTFAIFELAQNQEIQDKVRKEAIEVFRKYNGKMTYEAVMELSYAEKVIEETLRKYPPLSAIPRVCTKDFQIPGTDVVIEKGTATFIPAWGLQTDPKYFPDPDRFDPERFNEENRRLIKDFTYLPFGEGPRMCLGLRFGMMQSKVGLVSLVREFKFALNKRTSLPLKMQRANLILSVEGNIWVDIEKV